MKKFCCLIAAAALFAMTVPASAGCRGSEDIQIGIAGYSYKNFDIDQTLQYLKSMGVKYFSVKDFWLPLDSSAEQMAAFKEKCASYGIEGYILGPIYMKSKAEVDRAFDYAQRYGSDMFIGVPDYSLVDYVIKKVKKTGIRLAIHTHGPDNSCFPDITTVVEKFGDPSLGIGCCMDLGHSFRNGRDVAADIITYKDWIFDIHIKDETEASKAGRTCEMGRGRMDLVSIINALREIGYNGKLSIEFEKDSKAPHAGIAESVGYLRAILDATAPAAAQPINTLSAAEIADGWELLWDGKTTNGWRGSRSDFFPEKGWDIKDGILTVQKADGAEAGGAGDIITVKKYKNFIFTAEFLLTDGANSGIKYFVNPDINDGGEGSSSIGCEFQILDDELHPDAKLGVNGNRKLASLYDLIPAPAEKPYRKGEFNKATVIVRGNHVEHWLNGVKMVEYDRNTQEWNALVAYSKYKNWVNFGNQETGHILLQDHGEQVSYRNIKIKVLD